MSNKVGLVISPSTSPDVVFDGMNDAICEEATAFVCETSDINTYCEILEVAESYDIELILLENGDGKGYDIQESYPHISIEVLEGVQMESVCDTVSFIE